MNISIIVGTRPQYIKLLPLLNEFENQSIKFLIINTGQHYDKSLSTIFFQDFNIANIKYNLNTNNKSNFNIADSVNKISKIIKNENSNLVIVFGDCNTTLAGAIAAKDSEKTLIHIESGLRCGNNKMIEEKNRIKTDKLSDILFCPSEIAVKNLYRENIVKNVINTGDIMYDLFLQYKEQFNSKKRDSSYGVLTLHRKENLSEENLRLRFNQLEKLKNHQLIFPIHPNTERLIAKYKVPIPSNILKIKPLGWFKLMNYIKGADFVITDSGGIQKETFWMRKPCITIRNETEWIETINLGVNVLIKTEDSIKIPEFESKFKNPYGDGRAANKMVDYIINYNND